VKKTRQKTTLEIENRRRIPTLLSQAKLTMGQNDALTDATKKGEANRNLTG
jgi:hypothetical protein